ncbi:sensor histidine kinase RcsC [Salmonella enterica subsp. enterica serovar Choleraesuis]|nr:sensor histidine kinase RcsC [Salmonella enterica subsp. enterica serovar Choleraesuis]
MARSATLKHFVSFHATLKVSRYMFRALALVTWLFIALVSVFYIVNVLHSREADIRQEFAASFDQAQRYIQRTADVVKELRYIAENRLSSDGRALPKLPADDDDTPSTPDFSPLFPGENCDIQTRSWHGSLQSLAWFIRYWRDNFSASYDLNRVFLIDSQSQCVADFGLRNMPLERESTRQVLHDRILKYRNMPIDERSGSLYWISPGPRPGMGYFYALTPVYLSGNQQAMLGIEQTIRMDNFMTPGSLPIGITLFDDNGQRLLSMTGGAAPIDADAHWMQERSWFGYSSGFKALIMKKSLPPSSLNVVYSVPVDIVLERVRMLILNAVLLNLIAAALLFTLVRMYERRILIPAERDAQRLGEHEQFNRKIVASAPVGICILRTLDGTNILSNELAHNYLNMLTHEDRQRLTKLISDQQVNVVDVLTSNNTHLQISFVHSRYRNENVAICVLVDVSARVKMEESLQGMAQAAEQASQSKSMFLATVSHELRTPLYGIIGNLDLLQTKELPKGVDRLVTAMHNSSSLLLKIISDILDFSKIESEQLKIEPRPFAPREVMNHIAANYLPLVVRKQLGLYCFIEPDVPQTLDGDPMRLQQVISNLLSNAIKFTDVGCIILHVSADEFYLRIEVRDTGVGIAAKEVVRLFDPFFQVGTGVQRNFQGTGLGLAICEKLINMMDGDIAVDSEPGMGSRFTIRIPLYQASEQGSEAALSGKVCHLAVRNAWLNSYLNRLLKYNNITVADASLLPAPDDVLITDQAPPQNWPGLACIEFSRRHIGAAVEREPGHWLMSVAAGYELATVLGRIYAVPVTAGSTMPQLPVANEVQEQHDDLLILVVDDHPINRRLLADQLGSLGYQCKTANDGVDALSVLEKHAIDIVLTDVNMPNMDGYRLTQRIREMGMTLPVIGVTANALAEERQRCLESGMDSCLSKPVTLDVIRSTLAGWVKKVRASRADEQKT